jgi:hypothetical protein
MGQKWNFLTKFLSFFLIFDQNQPIFGLLSKILDENGHKTLKIS